MKKSILKIWAALQRYGIMVGVDSRIILCYSQHREFVYNLLYCIQIRYSKHTDVGYVQE